VDSPYRLAVEDSPGPADLALLEDHVAAAAIAAAGVGDDQEFGIFVRDDEGQILGGISGIVWGGCCELQAMWVDQSLRGRGLARELMTEAENEARRRGCTLVQFRAYDLLALGLYERLGYETVGVIEGCPAGSAARWYRKDLWTKPSNCGRYEGEGRVPARRRPAGRVRVDPGAGQIGADAGGLPGGEVDGESSVRLAVASEARTDASRQTTTRGDRLGFGGVVSRLNRGAVPEVA
jgi:GNAT superfamily N-acetyltransferase